MARSTLLRSSIVALAVFVLAAALVTARREFRPPAPKRPVRARLPDPPAAPPEPVDEPGEVWTLPAEAAPIAASPESETARAMDDAGLRFQVARLRMAALGGDPEVTESVQAGLRLYGRRASAVLASELDHEQDPAVRAAFAEARKSLR
jgi:hypothetical protein